MKRGLSELADALALISRDQLTRRRQTVESLGDPGSRLLRVQGRTVVDFSSNDYLGLARHPALTAAMAHCAEHSGWGSGASHLITGHGIEHERLEEELAAFTGRERALLFSTGYMANLAAITTLVGRGETVLLDRLSHASLIDGGLLSGARFKRFAHGDVSAAESALIACKDPVSVVATDGVFSMDGDVAPLDTLAHLSQVHKAWLVVDDAHGIGVVGPRGRGTLAHFGLDEQSVPVLIGTLGKALGSFGAFVAGCSDLIELLIQKARPYIYTTALPQPVAAATRTALEIADRESWRRERVLALAGRFRKSAAQSGLPVSDTQPVTPILPVLMGSSQAALSAQRELFEAGFWVVAIRPPTVPRGSARLRVTVSAAHTESQVDALVEALSRVVNAQTPSASPDAATQQACGPEGRAAVIRS